MITWHLTLSWNNNCITCCCLTFPDYFWRSKCLEWGDSVQESSNCLQLIHARDSLWLGGRRSGCRSVAARHPGNTDWCTRHWHRWIFWHSSTQVNILSTNQQWVKSKHNEILFRVLACICCTLWDSSPGSMWYRVSEMMVAALAANTSEYFH